MFSEQARVMSGAVMHPILIHRLLGGKPEERMNGNDQEKQARDAQKDHAERIQSEQTGLFPRKREFLSFSGIQHRERKQG